MKEYSKIKYSDMKKTMSKKEYKAAIKELTEKGFIKQVAKNTYELTNDWKT